jgi:hypothetical protein
MTNEERIRGVENAAISFSNILEAKSGQYARDLNDNIRLWGGQIHEWMEDVADHRNDEEQG